MSGGGQKSTTTTQSTAPWSGQQPYYSDIFNQSQNAYNQGNLTPVAYGGQMVADQSPYTLGAQNMIANQASGVSPITQGANQLAADTLAGNYLDPTKNPGWDQALTDIRRAYGTGTAASTDAAAAAKGAYGGSAYKELTGINNRQFADSLNQLAGNIYGQERQNQNQVLSMSPNLNAANYYGANQLLGIGSQNEAYNQDLINADINRFNINQDADYNALTRYAGLIGGNLGSTSTSTTPIYRNQAAGALGGAAAGAGTGFMIGGPMGAGIGAGIGGLGGYFL